MTLISRYRASTVSRVLAIIQQKFDACGFSPFYHLQRMSLTWQSISINFQPPGNISY
jgi:hypothetical protein